MLTQSGTKISARLLAIMYHHLNKSLSLLRLSYNLLSCCVAEPYYNLHNLENSFLDRSSTKQKTFDPVWNEEFIHEVENASTLGITVFHNAPLDDVFNANTTISFEDLLSRNELQQNDFWVDLEPSGRLRVKIDLRSSQGEPPHRWGKSRIIEKNTMCVCFVLVLQQNQPKHRVVGQTKINHFWIDVVVHCDDVFIRSMDTNSWRLFSVSQHFVLIAVSLFGELSYTVKQHKKKKRSEREFTSKSD